MSDSSQIGPQIGPRTGILVLGMHRAGTSLLTQVLTRLGCDAPRTLIGASENNESGYFESQPIRVFNDRLLAAANSQWDDWRAIDPDWFATPLAADFRAEATGLLATEFGPSPLFVLKDPRICRLVPFWTTVLTGAGVTPHVIVTTRNPIEVAASLGARNGHPPELAHMIWLRHMLDAEAASRGMVRSFTSYDALLQDWPALMTKAASDLGLSWPHDPKMVAKDHEIISPTLRHHRQAPADVTQNPALTRWLRDTYRILDGWSGDAEQATDQAPDQAALDQIRTELDAAGPTFGPLVAEARSSATLLHAANRRVAKLEANKAETDKRHDEARTQENDARAQEQVAMELRRLLDKAMTDLHTETERNRALAEKQARETLIRSAELARLSDLLDQTENALIAADIAQIRRAIRATGARFLPRRFGTPLAMWAVRRTGLFDAGWYLQANADVAAAGISPLRHYVSNGIAENRAPNPGIARKRA